MCVRLSCDPVWGRARVFMCARVHRACVAVAVVVVVVYARASAGRGEGGGGGGGEQLNISIAYFEKFAAVVPVLLLAKRHLRGGSVSLTRAQRHTRALHNADGGRESECSRNRQGGELSHVARHNFTKFVSDVRDVQRRCS